MTIRSILYSNDRRPRLARHGIFWLCYAIYFTLQSYFPTVEVKGISGYFVYVAFLSTLLYFPFCFVAAYCLLYYLYPRYLRWGRHLAFAWRFLALMLLGFVINYFTGIGFYRLSHREFATFFNIAFLGVHNATIAMITSISILGLRLGRDAWLQNEANLRLSAQKARAELQLLKTRIDPKKLFRTLDQLRTEVARKSPDAPDAILRLSEELSDILYKEEDGIALALDTHPRYKPEALPVAGPPSTGINAFIFKALFSTNAAIRLTRHFLFWVIRLINLTFVYHARVYTAAAPPGLTWATALNASCLEIAGELLLTYGIAYILFPLLFRRGKYGYFIGGSLALLVFVFNALYPHLMKFHFPKYGADYPLLFYTSLMEFIRTGFMTWLLFIAWRLNKQYFQRIRERVTLSREKAGIEFQLLKAQVHPHFLFNTLNNIYSFALDGSPRAEELLARLSSMMNYMIYDCEADLMPLQRELHLLEDYIGLEKARYGDRLKLQVDIQGDTGRHRIAPLLMIPFVENCFKHGASQVLNDPWLSMNIHAAGDRLDFRLSNNKPKDTAAANGKSGIGLKNIRQRLELLYPDRYQLEITPAGDVFSVHLVVPLEAQPNG